MSDKGQKDGVCDNSDKNFEFDYAHITLVTIATIVSGVNPMATTMTMVSHVWH